LRKEIDERLPVKPSVVADKQKIEEEVNVGHKI
jgi:hypothetical protein